MLKTNAFVLASAVMALGVLTAPAEAEAKWTRSHVYNCRTFGGAPIDHAMALKNNSSTSHMYVLCDINDSNSYLKEQIKTLNIHGRDGSPIDGVRAMACRSAWWTVGGSCGPQHVSSTPDVTNVTMTPSLSHWHPGTRADFGYLWIRLPRKHGNSQSSLNGFYTHD